MRNRCAGFSLLELMIVLIIISILTALAVPSFREYAQRARFMDVIIATHPFKLAVALALQQGISMNQLNSGSPYLPPNPLSNKHLASLLIEQGRIIATATQLAGASNYILTPNDTGSFWQVSGSCINKRLCHAD